MCTAITYQTNDFYFGRTLDYPIRYGEEIVITPRRFPLSFRHGDTLSNHHAFIGMAHIADSTPLYYEAVNEHGLGMAGLNFPGNAVYFPPADGKDNIASFEFIPWILAQCAGVAEARRLLDRIQLVDTAFAPSLPPSPLHWIIADRTEAVTVESTKDGLAVYDNPIGVLTNNPPFPHHMTSLADYRHLSPRNGGTTFAPHMDFSTYCGGMGAIGLPGDWSSRSRFIRAAFAKLNAAALGSDEAADVAQFFHILNSVAMPRGCVEMEDGQQDLTLYTACINATKGIYYYTTYENSHINAVDMHHTSLDSDALTRYPLLTDWSVHTQN